MSWVPYPAVSSGITPTRQNQVAHSHYDGPSASILNHANNTNITNSQINTNITTHIQARSAGLKTLLKNSATGAVYNSLERQRLDAPKCHPNTRVAVINRLIGWIKGEIDFDTLILWLYGAAGAGKSAIAHTLAELCDKDGLLLATFFFWKTAAERSDITRLIATIAYQIARAIPASRSQIKAAVDADLMIFHQSIDTQLSKLIVEPLLRLHSTGFDFKDSPFVIIIDGLDECQGTDMQSWLVKSLVAAFHHSPLRIRILIASRPEVHLQSTFNLSSVQPRLSRLALSNEYSPNEDIYRFLEDSFDKIGREHPLASYIPSSWPSADILRELTEKSSGQFIFASTTVKYIGGDSHQLPHRRLDVIRSLQPPRGEEDLPYAELNSLYNHVLSNVRDIERVKQVLGLLVIVIPLIDNYTASASRIDNYCSFQPGETRACLSQLASVIDCDCQNDEYISILHASLVDFLVDPSRSHQFYLCREFVLGESAALGLCRMLQGEYGKSDFRHCLRITISCIQAGSCCTPQLREELSRPLFPTIYRFCEMFNLSDCFWVLLSEIMEMLEKQNLVEQFPYLVPDLTTVYFQGLRSADPDKELILLAYEVQYLDALRIEVSNPALECSFNIKSVISKQTRQMIKSTVALHPQRHKFEFTAQHYATVALHFMFNHLYSSSSSCQSNDEFHMAGDEKKKAYLENQSTLLCIAHVLPLASKSEDIMGHIFLPEYRSGGWNPWNFHEEWTLDGWNDYIIKPARDSVLGYYKRYAEPFDIKEYMRLNHLS